MKLICRDCKEEFEEPKVKLRGFRDQCSDCSQAQAEPERLGGNMIWDHKTAPYIEIKPMSRALAFNAMANRHKVRLSA